MTQRSIEILIGRLTTNEAFRLAFRRDATTTLTGFVESGHELTPVEVAALRATPIGTWEQVARDIDPRLQQASLRGPSEEES